MASPSACGPGRSWVGWLTCVYHAGSQPFHNDSRVYSILAGFVLIFPYWAVPPFHKRTT